MPPTKPNHWIILSSPDDYSFDRVAKQRGKLVDWDVGLHLQSNQLLSQMRPRDRIIFLSTGNTWCLLGELQVYKAPYPDKRQKDDANSKYYNPDSDDDLYFRVPMKMSRKFTREIAWNEVSSSSDPKLQDIPNITMNQLVYKISEPHYRCILYLQKNKPTAIDNEFVVEEIAAPVIQESEITGKEPLGSGQFGQVYRAIFRHQIVAVKVLNVNPADLTDSELKKVKLEVDILRNTHCPHIIKFFGACITPKNVTIVTELLNKGELGKLLSDKDVKIDLFLKLRMARDIAVGMNWLHSSKPVQFLHRDLKPSNLLVDDNFRIKICDFGFCEVKDPELKKLQSKGVIGTLMYMAPEVLQNTDFSEKIDVYSFGLILWEIYTRQKLFADIGENDGQKLKDRILSGQRPAIPHDCPPLLRNIMENSWAANPENRPSFNDIVLDLSELLFDHYIEDPLGRDFWRKLEYHGVTEVEWSVFKKELLNEIKDAYEKQISELPDKPSATEILNASDHQLNSFSAKGMSNMRVATKEAIRRYKCDDIFLNQVDLDLDMKCLYTILEVKDNNGKVLLKNWGNILRWFGPLIDDNGYPGFLNRITRTLRLKCFHGYLGQHQASHMLKDKATRTYLVRFSREAGSFVFSYVSPSSDSIVHRRIQFCPELNGHFYFNEQKIYSLQLLIDAFTQQKYFSKPVKCSTYENLFEETASNYVMDNTEIAFLE